ncbi:hypothetical protein KKE48_00240 [Patescibacteria group bacterium]|nr:hypothetical protein [Patescibacteria group bacterium]MBU1499284.1 hypothetical protein [Patescibacteria group bacterium]
MPTLLKKISLVFILIFSLFAFRFLSPSPAQAEPKEFVKAVQEGNNLQWYLGGKSGMIATTTDSLLVAITGAYDENGKLISSGALQGTSTLMASLYQKPISTTQYLAYIINHSGLAKSAFAAGSGWDFLTKPNDANITSPILVLWTTSRNIVYLLFVVIFVTIGFMIMFRSKLNPQTVVNIQLALPSIIISLILVTFSFAICGLIIDFVYLGHNLIGAIFFEAGTQPLQYTLPPTGFSSYPEAISNFDIIQTFLVPSSTTWGGINIWTSLGKFFLGMADFLSNLGTSGASSVTIGGALIPLILAFTLLGTALKIFFGLITKYVTLILSTIFSPFVFLFTAMPGKSEGTGNFLKTMLSAALTFPAVAFMFFLASYFANDTIGLSLESLPPLNKVGALAPGLTTSSIFGIPATISRVLEPLIALGLLMATTQVPQAIDQALGVKPGITGAATPEVGGALRKIPIIGSLLG